MPARFVCLVISLGLILLVPTPASAESTSVQEVPCQPGPELLLARDGTVSACRMAAAAELLVGPAAGNDKIGCAASSRVEFHRNGYLSFCERTGSAGSYATRSRLPTRCRSGSRVAFDENGYLEYCS